MHVSGHAAQEEQKLVLSLQTTLRCTCARRVQAPEASREHRQSLGLRRGEHLLLENGARIEFRDGNARRIEDVPAGTSLVDAGAVAETPEGVMHERQQLSEEGMFIVVARVNAQTGEPLGPLRRSPAASSAPRAPTGLSKSQPRSSAPCNAPLAGALPTSAS